MIAELVATGRHPVTCRQELLGAGLTSDQISDRLASGHLQPLYRGVYAVGHRRLTREGEWTAATKTCEGAVLSHLDAATLWAIVSPRSGDIDLTTASRAGRRRRAGLRIHRVPVDPRDETRRRGIPVTTPARTLVDVAEMIPARRLERALDEARYLGLITSRSLTETLDRNGGRLGATRLSALLAVHRPGATRTRSGLEEHFLALCRSSGLPQPLVNEKIEGMEVDFVWSAARLAVETDSYATHGGQAAFERDHRRDLRLRTAGWKPLRFTDRQLADEPDLVVESLRRELA